MKKKTFTLLLLTALLSSCHFAGDLLDYQKKAKDFSTALNERMYDSALAMMDTDALHAHAIPSDSIISPMHRLHDFIDREFGPVVYNEPYVEMKKGWTSTNGVTTSQPTARISFDNGKKYGFIDLTFDPKTKKILSFYIVDSIGLVPSPWGWYTFMILGILNAAFIIYTVARIRQSDSLHKKRKYLLALLLNAPSICYNATLPITVNLFEVQFILGSGFKKTGNIGLMWTLGIPLGSLIVWYMLYKEKKASDEAQNEKEQIENYVYDLPTDVEKVEVVDDSNSNE